jgi:hypothetical protein
MITRAQIIADLMACLASIDPAQGFPLAVRELRRGIHLAEEMAEMPALTLFNERVETLDQTSSTAARRLVLHLWGAVHVRHEDYSQLDQLAAACLQALADPTSPPTGRPPPAAAWRCTRAAPATPWACSTWSSPWTTSPPSTPSRPDTRQEKAGANTLMTIFTAKL